MRFSRCTYCYFICDPRRKGKTVGTFEVFTRRRRNAPTECHSDIKGVLRLDPCFPKTKWSSHDARKSIFYTVNYGKKSMDLDQPLLRYLCDRYKVKYIGAELKTCSFIWICFNLLEYSCSDRNLAAAAS